MSIATAERRGALARPSQTSSPPRWTVGGHFSYRNEVYELRMLDALSGVDKPWTHGPAEFALVEDGPLLLICYRFHEAQPWAAADFRWSSERLHAADHPPVGSTVERRALISVTAAGGDGVPPLTRANYTLSLDFTRALHSAIRERTTGSFDPESQNRAILVLASRWPSVHVLATRACVHCIGAP